MATVPSRKVGVEERRARLARRHRLAPAHRAGDALECAASLVALHATDPATVFLSAWARVDGFAVDDLETALYVDRTLVKHLAMRRTLFVFPRDVLPEAQAGASGRVAATERKRLIADVERADLHADGARWLDRAAEQVLAALADGREATSTELRDEIPLLEGSIVVGEGKTWGSNAPIGPRVLSWLSASGLLVRSTNAGPWTASRPRWTSMRAWLGDDIAALTPEEGTARLVERWLRAFGPGTEVDLKWWLGSTLTAVRRALPAVGAVPVDLDGSTGYLLPDDLEPVGPAEPWVALLPPLDPTTMGWFERDWYLGPHRSHLFDSRGNAGHTAWCDGRIVGGWRQQEDGAVELQLLEDVGSDACTALDRRARELTEWFAGVRTSPRFPSPLSQHPA